MDEAVSVVLAVANEFLRRARAEGRSLRPTPLHELCYCAHGEHLARGFGSLLAEPVCAHRGGVYVAELKRAGGWGVQAVDGLFSHCVDGRVVFPRLAPQDPATATVEAAWKRYGRLSCYDLTRLVLAPGGPWDRAWNAAGTPAESRAIPDAWLREWFAARAARPDPDPLPPAYRTQDSPLRA